MLLAALSPAVTAAIVAAAGTVFVSMLVRLLDNRASGRNSDMTDLGNFRRDLLERVSKLEDDLEDARGELDQWKTRYYEVASEQIELTKEAQALRAQVAEQGATILHQTDVIVSLKKANGAE